MDTDPFQYISNKICHYFLRNDSKNASKLIRMHTGRLADIGDLSFPSAVSIWLRYIKKECEVLQNGNILHCDNLNKEEDLREFLKETLTWLYPAKQILIENDRYLFFFERTVAMKNLFQLVLESLHYGNCTKSSKKSIHIYENGNVSDSLSNYRAKLVELVITNVIKYSEWQYLSTPESASVVLTISDNTSLRHPKCETNGNVVNIKCGVVLDSSTGKATKLTYDEYLRLRSNDVQLIAMHKYGLRAHNEECFTKLIYELGKTAVIIDLLQVRCTSSVSLTEIGQGCTKGAPFILYNSARIETLLRKFNEKVRQGIYPPLPPLEEINVTLLKEEEEWQLMYVFVFSFPSVIRTCFYGLENGQCRIHLIPKFLSELASVFSIYYRRIRILVENRSHLIPLIHARIYLIMCIRTILNTMLSFLNIQPVQHM